MSADKLMNVASSNQQSPPSIKMNSWMEFSAGGIYKPIATLIQPTIPTIYKDEFMDGILNMVAFINPLRPGPYRIK